ncbi:TPA: hypothetical protein DCX15_06050 [bacterium]|nr:hypothetical protein [bacterium]
MIKKNKKRDFEKIGSILERTIKNLGLEHQIEKEMIFQVWKDVVGEEINKHTKPLSLQKKMLVVEVDSPTWNNELNLQKKGIKKKINQIIGKNVIKDIYLKIGSRDVSSYWFPNCDFYRFN